MSSRTARAILLPWNAARLEGGPEMTDDLLGARCDDPDVLHHCLSPGPRVWGCWVLDHLLGKSRASTGKVPATATSAGQPSRWLDGKGAKSVPRWRCSQTLYPAIRISSRTGLIFWEGVAMFRVVTACGPALLLAAYCATPAPTQFCGCPGVSGIAVTACSSICSTGNAPGTYATVSAQGTYSTLMNYSIVPSSYTFNAQSTVRLK